MLTPSAVFAYWMGGASMTPLILRLARHGRSTGQRRGAAPAAYAGSRPAKRFSER
jgi:hypothetical protein